MASRIRVSFRHARVSATFLQLACGRHRRACRHSPKSNRHLSTYSLVNQNSAHFPRVSSGAVRAPRSVKIFRTPYPRIACPSRPGIDTRRGGGWRAGPGAFGNRLPFFRPRAASRAERGCAGMEAAAAEKPTAIGNGSLARKPRRAMGRPPASTRHSRAHGVPRAHRRRVGDRHASQLSRVRPGRSDPR